MEDERKERRGISHVRYCKFSNLLSDGHCGAGAGDHLVIMWGMSVVGPRRKEFDQDGSERMHSREL